MFKSLSHGIMGHQNDHMGQELTHQTVFLLTNHIYIDACKCMPYIDMDSVNLRAAGVNTAESLNSGAS